MKAINSSDLVEILKDRTSVFHKASVCFRRKSFAVAYAKTGRWFRASSAGSYTNPRVVVQKLFKITDSTGSWLLNRFG